MRISKTRLIFNALIWQKKKKKSNFNFCSWFSFFFYLIFKKIIKSKWVVRQFKSEFQKLVKSWDSILRICNNFAIKRLSPHCGWGVGGGSQGSSGYLSNFVCLRNGYLFYPNLFAFSFSIFLTETSIKFWY